MRGAEYVNAGEFLDLAGPRPDGVPQLRDDDVSIPVLADVLEAGDPTKADPAVPRQAVEHAWTDALQLHTHGEPLAAVPTLSDVIVEGDPSFTHPSPRPAEAALTIPLLTEVLPYDEVSGRFALADETHGSPIPLLTDRVEDPIATAPEPAADIPVLTEALHDEADIPVLTEALHDEADIPVLTEALHDEADIPVLTEALHDEADIPELTEKVHDEAEIPELTEAVNDEAEIPELTEAVHDEAEIPELTEAVQDESEIPVLAEAERFAPLVQDVAVPVFEEHIDAEALAASAHTAPELLALASTADAHLFDPELPFRAYCSFPGEKAQEPLLSGTSDVPDTYPMAHVPQPFGSAIEHTVAAEHETHVHPEAANSEELDPRDFGDHLPHRLVDTLEAVELAPEALDLRDFGHAESTVAADPAPVVEARAAEPAVSDAASEPEELESAFSEPPFSTSEAVTQATAEAVPAASHEAGSAAHVSEPVDTAVEMATDAVGMAQVDEHAFALDDAASDEVPATQQSTPVDASALAELPSVSEAAASEAEVFEPEASGPASVSEVAPASEVAHTAVMDEAEADHVAAVLSRHEPIAAELTEPEPELHAVATSEPTPAELERVAAEVSDRALKFLSGDGHSLIEERCQEQAVWLAHRITREIAASLEREIGQWVQQAIKDTLGRRESDK